MVTERLYIVDVQKELHYRDRRSVRRWCRNNDVTILCDVGSNKQYVLREEYDKGKLENYSVTPRIMNTTKRFFAEKFKNKANNLMDYKPKGEYEKKVLSIFTNLI